MDRKGNYITEEKKKALEEELKELKGNSEEITFRSSKEQSTFGIYSQEGRELNYKLNYIYPNIIINQAFNRSNILPLF